MQQAQTILIVEDENSVRMLAVRILKMAGFQTLEAADGLQALEVCEQQDGQIHAVLTDMNMPNMDGYELMKRLRTDYPHMGVVFISGFSEDDTLPANVTRKGMAFVQKPFSKDKLVSTIRATIAEAAE
jgi:CheY-like chemotaxis protein